MLGLHRSNEVPEYSARGETARVYHDIKQSLRVSGVNLLFRSWAVYKNFLPLMCEAARPTLITVPFETAADELRKTATFMASTLAPTDPLAVSLGDSQRFQIEAALDLYHYINPKLHTCWPAKAIRRASPDHKYREHAAV